MILFFSLLWTQIACAGLPAPFLADLKQFREKSLIVRSSQAELEAASTATIASLLEFGPSLRAGVGKTREYRNGVRNSSSLDYWNAKADWNLFHGGSDFFSWRAASGAERGRKLKLESQELATELSGAKLVFRNLYLRDVAVAQKELLSLKQETLRIGQDRFKQGKIPLQEVTKMEVDLSQQQNLVRSSEMEIAENEAAYRSLFLDKLQTEAWPITDSQEAKLVGGAGSLDAQRQVVEAEAAHNSWRAARARHLPSLDFALSYQEFPLKGNRNTEWTGALELSIPLWSRYQTTANSARAYAAYSLAENAAASVEREEQAKRELLEKKISLSRANLRDSKKNLEQSNQLYQSMLRTFQLGRLSTNDLFQEQNRKIQSVLLYAQNRLAFHESVMEACALWGLSATSCLP